ncbi:MAG: flagellar hook-length control protein FliK [Halothiobacillaceae bacterium]
MGVPQAQGATAAHQTALSAAVSQAIGAVSTPPALSSLQQSGMLQAALAQSGLFAEANLAHGRVDPGDLKIQLMRAIARLRNLDAARSLEQGEKSGRRESTQADRQGGSASLSGGPVGSLLDAALAHVGGNQIRTAMQQLQGQAYWLAEIPFTHEDETRSLRMAIEGEEESDAGEEGRRWRVDFRFDLPGLGPIFVNLTMKDRNLDTRLFIDQASTRELAESMLPTLDRQLKGAGFETGHMNVLPGPPPKSFVERLSASASLADDAGFSVHA